jgi:hypothetical protein
MKNVKLALTLNLGTYRGHRVEADIFQSVTTGKFGFEGFAFKSNGERVRVACVHVALQKTIEGAIAAATKQTPDGVDECYNAPSIGWPNDLA